MAIAYVRVSTERQGLGLEAQRAAIDAHAARTGSTVAATYEDRASGRLAVEERPQLLAALAALREHNAGVLLVARRDRIARDVLVAGLVDQLAERAGARVVSCAGEGTEDTGPSGQFLRSVIDAAAQFEGASIRARTRAALAARKARGLRIGGVPYGFRAEASGQLVPEAREQATIARVRELVAIGHTIDEARGVLAREGYRARSGRPFSRARVGALFVLAKEDTGQ